MKVLSSIRLAIRVFISLLREFPERYKEEKELEEAYKRALETPIREWRFGKAVEEMDFERWKKKTVELGNIRWK
ncbi:MAG: hypothetical protein DRP29_00360 [Thermodesulfobacteriota bacterium]|nr:MAG: hypothetical protein DRP29_00360 [Thermodesulfobacteriota bacterium]